MIDINELSTLANKKEKENLRFRSYLKTHADEEELDKQFKRLHEKYFKIYDCSKCRNCCQKIGTILEEKELDKICKYLKLDKETFVKNNMKEEYGRYYFCNKECLFLNDDNECIVEKCLPISCKDYPYTNKEERLFNLYSIIGNASICPVVYEILEELKKEYHFR